MYRLMAGGKVLEGQVNYDTLLLIDSLLPAITVQTDGQLWRIDTALPCLTRKMDAVPVFFPLLNAAGDTLAKQFGNIGTLQIGSRKYADIGGGLLTDSAFARLQRQGIEGIIGANLMQHNTWHFDWANKRVIIAPSPEKFISLPQTIALPFNRTLFRSPKWQVQFNRFPYQLVMQLSTGFAGGILLDAEFTANHTSFMYDNELQPMQLPYSIHGITSGQGLVMDSLQVEGLHTFDNLPVMHSQSHYGLLGMAFFGRYRLTIDWRQRTVWLHARSSDTTHLLPRSKTNS